MPLAFGASVVEGKVYRGKKKRDDEEDSALKELQKILAYKNRKMCDCEAQIHELLENCLNCGRLSCIVEGSGKCFTCGNLILDASQRNRFKQFIDIMQAQPSQAGSAGTSCLKTRIIDNQYDQVSIQSKKHITQEERAKMSENLSDLQNQRHQRKLMLDVDIENLEEGVVPIKSVPKVDDYAGELQRLQLDDQPSLFETKVLLSDLVFREYKKNQNIVYIEPKQDIPKEAKPEKQVQQTDQSKSTKQYPQADHRKAMKSDPADQGKQPRTSEQSKQQAGKKQSQSNRSKSKPKPKTAKAWNQQASKDSKPGSSTDK